MKKYVDAEELKAAFRSESGEWDEMRYPPDVIDKVVDALSVKDVAEVIRCKDCKDCKHSKWVYVCGEYNFTVCEKTKYAVSLDHYCGYAERRS